MALTSRTWYLYYIILSFSFYPVSSSLLHSSTTIEKMLSGALSTDLAALSSAISTSTTSRQSPSPFGQSSNSTGSITTETGVVTTKTRWHAGSTVAVTCQLASDLISSATTTVLPGTESSYANSTIRLTIPPLVGTNSMFVTVGYGSSSGPVPSTTSLPLIYVSPSTPTPSKPIASSTDTSARPPIGSTSSWSSGSSSTLPSNSSGEPTPTPTPSASTQITQDPSTSSVHHSKTTKTSDASKTQSSSNTHDPSRTATSSLKSAASSTARIEDSHEIPGPMDGSCGLREKQIALAEQASMEAARGMKAVMVTYNGSREYLESHPCLADRMETTMNTIRREALEKYLSKSNVCEGQ